VKFGEASNRKTICFQASWTALIQAWRRISVGRIDGPRWRDGIFSRWRDNLPDSEKNPIIF
jgi:hypothetical protein